MIVDGLYGMPNEVYFKLDLATLTPQDLEELAYYIWSFHEDNEELLKWRETVLLPVIQQQVKPEEAIPEDEGVDGE